MKLSWRIILLVLFTTTLSGLANYLLARYQAESLHNNSEKILANTVFQSLRDVLVQDVIDDNKLRVTNVLKKLQNNNNPIEYLYITNGGPRHIFAHSFEKGFPRYLLADSKGHLEKYLGQTGIKLTKKIQTDRGLIYVYAEPLLLGLEAVLHIGINQSEIKQQLTKNSQIILMTSIAIALLVLLIAAFWSKKITTPLVNFTQQLKRYGDGEGADFTQVKTNTPEIQLLASTFQQATSERQQAVTALQEREQNLSLTLNSIGDAVITTDAKGRVTRMNPVAENMTGWSFQEADGQPLKTIFPIVNASTREPIENPVEKVLVTGETVYLSNHTTLIAKDGTEYQIADSAAPIRNGDDHILGMVLIFNDVTAQYKLREEIRLSEQRLRLYHEQAPMASIEWNTDFQVVSWNSAAEQMFGYALDEVKGRYFVDIMLPKNAIVDVKQIWKDLIAQTGGELSINENLTKQGKIILCEWHNTPLKDESGKVIGAASIVQDITERTIQAELLQRTQKMDALGKLTGGIAHDYNNMLGVILGYSELLEEVLGDQPSMQGYVKEIYRAAERGAKLTKKLLSFSKRKTSEADVLNINSLLKDERDILEKTLTARIKLNLDLENNIWPVRLDSGDLEDAIINLSINAMHAIKGNGQLTIQTSNISISKDDAKLLQLDTGDYVSLNIVDTGCGMNEETKNKIFEPFYTTKGETGTGLGLSQVYAFVERSGGTIKVYSELEHGTRLSLYFPRYHDGNNTESVSAEKIRIMDLTGTGTILIVDDEPALINLSSDILGNKGYRIIAASSAKQALEILETEVVDLLLSDVIMPEMDGYQLASIVQEKYPAIKIQMASGFSDDRHLNMIDDSLHKQLLYKPFSAQILLSRIKELLG